MAWNWLRVGSFRRGSEATLAGKRFGGFEQAHGARAASAAGTREAAETAVAVLKAGGNVVYAAIAGSAVLAVMLPNANSIGGDLLALVKLGGKPVLAVNATGAAPRRASIEAYKALGHSFVPEFGGLAVQGPGLVAGWQALHERWATKPLAELLAPAIALARDGFPTGWRVAEAAGKHVSDYASLPGWKAVFAPEGIAIKEGEKFRQPALARTLSTIAEKVPAPSMRVRSRATLPMPSRKPADSWPRTTSRPSRPRCCRR